MDKIPIGANNRPDRQPQRRQDRAPRQVVFQEATTSSDVAQVITTPPLLREQNYPYLGATPPTSVKKQPNNNLTEMQETQEQQQHNSKKTKKTLNDNDFDTHFCHSATDYGRHVCRRSSTLTANVHKEQANTHACNYILAVQSHRTSFQHSQPTQSVNTRNQHKACNLFL